VKLFFSWLNVERFVPLRFHLRRASRGSHEIYP